MTPAFSIRSYDDEDAAALAVLYHDAVHAIAAGDYTPEQLRAWSPAPGPVERWRGRAERGRWVKVAAEPDSDWPLGFIELEPDGHIDCFYCRPDAAGTGVGRALYAALEAEARERGIGLLFVEASEPARRFFLRAGFTEERRRELQRNGVWLHNYRMVKRLGSPG